MRPLLALALVSSLLAACDPELHGECVVEGDCPAGTQCLEGLCLAIDGFDGGTEPDAGPTTDGGTTDAGRDGGSDAGTDAGTVAPRITIVSPLAGVAGPVPLAVTVSAVAPGGVESVQVRFEPIAGGPSVKAVATSSGEGLYRATVDLASPLLTSGQHRLVAELGHGGGLKIESAPVAIHYDRSGPVATFDVTYPVRTAGHPATGAFLRSELVTLLVTLTDAPAGLGPGAPTMTANGLASVTGVSEGAGVFRFSFQGKAPVFAQLEGDLSLQLAAKDALGNASTTTGSVKISRRRWIWSNVSSKPITAAPALSGGLLYLGSSDDFVYALHKHNGVKAWDYDTGSDVVGHITAGASTVYAATKDGRVHALDSSELGMLDSDRRRFRCSADSSDGGLENFVSGVALGTTRTSFLNNVEEETLFGFTEDGRIRMLRKSNFPTDLGLTGGCTSSLDLETANVGTVPVLSTEGGDTVAFVGDELGYAYKVSFSRDNDGVYTVSKEWRYDAGDEQLVAPFAIGLAGAGVLAVIMSLENAVVRAIDFQKTSLWSGNPKVLNDLVHASPVLAGNAAYFVDQKGKAQKALAFDASKQWNPAFSGQARGADARASPVVGKDGRTYLAAGSVLSALRSDGSAEWSFDTRPGGSGTASLFVDLVTPVLGCDGTLYLSASSASQGLVYAIETDSPGLATDGWPKAGHDNRNTFNAAAPLPSTGSCSD